MSCCFYFLCRSHTVHFYKRNICLYFTVQILLDDSPLKCASNPAYTFVNPTPYHLDNKLVDCELAPDGPLCTYLRYRAGLDCSDPNELRAMIEAQGTYIATRPELNVTG